MQGDGVTQDYRVSLSHGIKCLLRQLISPARSTTFPPQLPHSNHAHYLSVTQDTQHQILIELLITVWLSIYGANTTSTKAGLWSARLFGSASRIPQATLPIQAQPPSSNWAPLVREKIPCSEF